MQINELTMNFAVCFTVIISLLCLLFSILDSISCDSDIRNKEICVSDIDYSPYVDCQCEQRFDYAELSYEHYALHEKYALLTNEHTFLSKEHDRLKDCTNSMKKELCNAGVTGFCERTTVIFYACSEGEHRVCMPLYDGEFCKTIKCNDDTAMTGTIYRRVD